MIHLGGLTAAILWALSCGHAPEERPQSLVLVVIDTLRQDRVGAYGHPGSLTPTIDGLAGTGVRADGISPTSWTRPAVATLFTGLEPLRHQVLVRSDRIPSGASTLAEHLDEAGFSTLAISTNGHVAPAWGFARGFDRFVSTWKVGLGPRPDGRAVNETLSRELSGLVPPFFLYVHYLDPHLPYEPARAADGGPLSTELAALVPLTEASVRGVDGGLDSERLRAASALYDAEVRGADEALGGLLAELERRGLMRGTLVVVTSDHGEELGERGRLGHGWTLYEEAIRVPLVFSGPGAGPAGARLGEFPLADVFPTLLALFGQAVDPGAVDGRDRARELAGRGTAEPEPLLLHTEGVEGAAVAWRSGGWKLALGRDPFRKELFDLGGDPGESHNLLRGPGRAPEVFSSLARDLTSAYSRQLADALRRETTDADRELAEQIAALGYGGARTREFAERAFPRRLEPADPEPGGLRGWEPVPRFTRCIEPIGDPEGQLLAGWHAHSGDEPGRWSTGEATFALPALAAPRAQSLVIEASSHAPWPQGVRIEALRADVAFEGEVAPGPVRLELPLPGTSSVSEPARLFRLVVTPAYRPSESGRADARRLGLLVRSICLEPAG